jgi:hypothetical protein
MAGDPASRQTNTDASAWLGTGFLHDPPPDKKRGKEKFFLCMKAIRIVIVGRLENNWDLHLSWV